MKSDSINQNAPPAKCHLKSTEKPQQQATMIDDETTKIENVFTNWMQSPPNSDNNSDTEQEPIQVSLETFEKLKKLYEIKQFVRNTTKYESIDLNDVVVRLKKFKNLDRDSTTIISVNFRF